MSHRAGGVLHLIDTTGPGGAETIFLQVAAGLRDRGWSPHAVVVGPGWVLDQVKGQGLPVSVIETAGRFDVRYLLRLRAAARRTGARLIHAHLFSPAVYASVVGASLGIPVVATFHGTTDTHPGGPSRRIRHRLIARQGVVACVSEKLRDDLLADGAVDPARVRVVHNGVDLDGFSGGSRAGLRSAHGVPDDAFLVGALGNVRPAKDYRTLLRAAAELGPVPGLAFAVAGQRTDPLYGELLEERSRLGLDERQVAFWGFQEDVPSVMAAFDVLAISSESEGFSLAAVQAMAAGTPVVATRSGGPERIITDGVDGLLVPPKDPRALAGALRRLIEDPGLRRRLAGAARETVEARFSLSAMLDGYERLYAELSTRS